MYERFYTEIKKKKREQESLDAMKKTFVPLLEAQYRRPKG
jgi:hypothetical protein